MRKVAPYETIPLHPRAGPGDPDLCSFHRFECVERWISVTRTEMKWLGLRDEVARARRDAVGLRHEM